MRSPRCFIRLFAQNLGQWIRTFTAARKKSSTRFLFHETLQRSLYERFPGTSPSPRKANRLAGCVAAHYLGASARFQLENGLDARFFNNMTPRSDLSPLSSRQHHFFVLDAFAENFLLVLRPVKLSTASVSLLSRFGQVTNGRKLPMSNFWLGVWGPPGQKNCGVWAELRPDRNEMESRHESRLGTWLKCLVARGLRRCSSILPYYL